MRISQYTQHRHAAHHMHGAVSLDGVLFHSTAMAPLRTCSNMRACHLSKAQAEAFYSVHAGKPFFEKLTTFMSSGRIVALELVAEGAITRWRRLIGPTNSETVSLPTPCHANAHDVGISYMCGT